MRILIAEDDFTSRTALVGALEKEGHDVIDAVNGSEAWDVLRQPDSPMLVILDWMMPEMDGTEVASKVRALQSPHSPYIIMLTSRGEKVDIIAGLAAGANDYLCKPFDFGELIARVKVGQRMVEMQAALAVKVEELQRALDQIKTLRGIVPICASCKKIRDDRGYWNRVEVYISERTEAEFSHGICPECMVKLYPEYDSFSKE